MSLNQFFVVFANDTELENKIVETLSLICPRDSQVKYSFTEKLSFAKIVSKKDTFCDKPYYNGANGYAVVSSFDASNLISASNKFEGNNYRLNNLGHAKLFSALYGDYKDKMFDRLAPLLDFCSVIYDESDRTLIAGISKSSDENIKLYYGYTKDGCIMITNNKDFLLTFCKTVEEIPEMSVMSNIEISKGNRLSEGKTVQDALSLIDMRIRMTTSEEVKMSLEEIKCVLEKYGTTEEETRSEEKTREIGAPILKREKHE